MDRRGRDSRRIWVRRACVPWRRLGPRLITTASARQIGCSQPLADATGVALHGQVHDLEADGTEAAEAGGRKLRKEAEGRETRNGVDLVEVELFAIKQEVDSGKALAANGAICLKAHLRNLPAKAPAHLGADRCLGHAIA